MKRAKIFLTITAILLFVFNYQICEYFYPLKPQLKSWWTLKVNIYAVIMMLIFLSQSLGSKKWLRFFLEIGVGFSISSVIDKLYFSVHDFTNSDIYMILITVAFATYNLIYGNKQSVIK